MAIQGKKSTGAALLMALIVGCGCGRAINAALPADEVAPSDALVVNLPTIDFEKPPQPPDQGPPPEPLGVDIPASSEFIVRFEARVPHAMRNRPVVFRAQRRAKSGILVTTAHCFVKPIAAKENAGTISYEGLCPQPARAADVLITLQMGKDIYLVGTATIR